MIPSLFSASTTEAEFARQNSHIAAQHVSGNGVRGNVDGGDGVDDEVAGGDDVWDEAAGADGASSQSMKCKLQHGSCSGDEEDYK